MARRNVDEELLTDVVVGIPKERERYFGCAGKMLKPSRFSVEALVEKIPRGTVITIASLRKTLAEKHDAQTTCPFLTKRATDASCYGGIPRGSADGGVPPRDLKNATHSMCSWADVSWGRDVRRAAKGM